MKGNPAKHTKDISIAVQFSKDFIKLTHLFDRINVREGSFKNANP